MAGNEAEALEETLNDLEHSLTRLRVDYEQYFRGSARREPSQLAAKVQKLVTRLSAEPPKNTALKFRFNSLVARYQSARQQWGRILREIEAGTYKPLRFRMALQERASEETPDPTKARRREADAEKSGSSTGELHEALIAARNKTGQSVAGLTAEKLERTVKQQTEAILAKHGDVRVRFKVVVEGKRAKLKAVVSKN